jgi:recombinational DNA repair protein RecR
MESGGGDVQDQYEMIKNEINFLRELRICENIVQLERCYVRFDPDRDCKTISLVMVFA